MKVFHGGAGEHCPHVRRFIDCRSSTGIDSLKVCLGIRTRNYQNSNPNISMKSYYVF